MILDLSSSEPIPFAQKDDRSLQIRCLRPAHRYHEALLIRGLFLECLLRPEAAQFLFNYQLDDIRAQEAWMVIAQTEALTVGGLYAHFDDDGLFWLRGAVVWLSRTHRRRRSPIPIIRCAGNIAWPGGGCPIWKNACRKPRMKRAMRSTVPRK